MRAILINMQGVHEVELDPKDRLKSMYQHLDCTCVTGAGYVEVEGVEPQPVWADDEALLSDKPIQRATRVAWYPQPLIGNLLITGINDEGDTTACELTIDQVKDQIMATGMKINDLGAE